MPELTPQAQARELLEDPDWHDDHEGLVVALLERAQRYGQRQRNFVSPGWRRCDVVRVIDDLIAAADKRRLDEITYEDWMLYREQAERLRDDLDAEGGS